MEPETTTQGDRILSGVLESAAELLAADPESAATRASEVLDTVPGQPQALLLLIGALKVMGAEEGAGNLLDWMAREYPNLASVHYELGCLLGGMGKTKDAIERFSRAVALEPNHPLAWRGLGDQLARNGDHRKAREAYARHLRISLKELKFVEDATVADAHDLGKAENILNQALAINPTDVVTVRMLGEFHLRMGRLREAEATIRRAVDLAPGCIPTRNLYCVALNQLMDWKGSNEQLQILLEQQPGNPRLQAMLAANLIMLGERDEALRIFDKVRTEVGTDKEFWLNYGHAGRAVGRDNQVIVDAYRKGLELDPGFGAAWWALADLKTYRFSPAEIEMMREQLKREDLADGQRSHLEFALGKALEDEGAYAESFEHYSNANARRRPYVPYNADSVHADIARAKSVFTPAFFSARKGRGCLAPDPIFIVGMPRAGSTLVEQILASHSQVEGTMELPDLGDMVGRLIRQNPDKPFPDLLLDFDDAALRKLGEDYLERTRYQRKLGRPFFTDKAGNNFVYVGLIHIILPNAKIIDARRHPLACGFSCYKQAFAPGALHLSYDQTDVGRYYRDYADVMRHYDKVLPGRVHRIFHESLLENPDAEIRRLLQYCGLPFEEQCLRFHETERTVRTSSSQQVRQPIQKKKVEIWQHYEAYLQPMKDALGEVLTRYPEMPEFSPGFRDAAA
jgi:tetratricopeptide (TPR) repeat protein